MTILEALGNAPNIRSKLVAYINNVKLLVSTVEEFKNGNELLQISVLEHFFSKLNITFHVTKQACYVVHLAVSEKEQKYLDSMLKLELITIIDTRRPETTYFVLDGIEYHGSIYSAKKAAIIAAINFLEKTGLLN